MSRDPDASAAAPVVPGYVLQELLGRGGSGEVWRALPRGGGPPVAVKVLVDGDPERQAREAALLAQLDHPHLVRLHDVVHQPRRGSAARVALVLDLLDGGSLAALLARRRRLRPGEVVTTIAPVAAALAAAHERGILHGDLSPGNIVFTAEGRPVLTDLGVARVLGDDTHAGATPAYVDPTVARGGAPGPASDVFGVAAAAFHALTGIPPWNAATPADTLRIAAEGRLPDLTELVPDAPPGLVAVVERGLAADPHRRGSAAAFALDLRAACRPEPVRLPTAAATEAEGRTSGPRAMTELTHQVPRAARSAEASPLRPPPPRLALARRGALRALGGVGRLLPSAVRPVGLLVLCASVVLGVVWAATAWTGGAADGAGARVAASGGSAGAGPGRPTFAAGTAAASIAGAVPEQQATPATPDEWRAVVQALYRRRAEAFVRGRPTLLGEVYSAASPQLAADRAALDSMLTGGRVLRGFAPAEVRVREARTAGDRAELRLVDGWSAYEVVPLSDPGGAAVATGAAREATPVRMVLRRTGEGWRIETVERTT